MGIDVKTAWLGAVVLAAGLALGGCDEEEGCLDFRALSVDIYAERQCEDCCEFPFLQIQQLPVRSVTGERELVSRNTTFVDAGGDTARITGLLYYLHDVELEYEDGVVVPLVDTFGFRQNESLDFTLASRSLLRSRPLQTANLETGELLREGTITAVRFAFGLPEDAVAVDPLAQRTSSPLFLQGADTLLASGTRETGFALRSAFLQVTRASGQVDTTLVEGAASVPLRVALPTPLFLRRSFNLRLTLEVPVAPLVDLPAGPVTAEQFVGAYLVGATVVSATATR